MQTTERRLIEDLFARLRSAEGQSRDPEIERLIAAELQRAPLAPYAMAQTIIGQNQALEAAAARIKELEGGQHYEYEEDEPVRGAMGTPNLGRPGSGPGSVPGFGRGAGVQQQGGGFLANAGQVALGVAGGMLIGEAAKSLLGTGSEAQAATGAANTASTDNPLSQDAGAGDVGGGAEEGGGGGLFGWLFGGDTSQDNNADHDTADSGWDDGGDSSGD